MSAEQLLNQLSAGDVLAALEADTTTVARIAAAMIESREISAADWVDLRVSAGRVRVLHDLIQRQRDRA
jgi:hypothetical protein